MGPPRGADSSIMSETDPASQPRRADPGSGEAAPPSPAPVPAAQAGAPAPPQPARSPPPAPASPPPEGAKPLLFHPPSLRGLQITPSPGRPARAVLGGGANGAPG